MADDPVDPLGLNSPAPVPAVVPTVTARPHTITCSFCQCVLTSDGDHLSLSERAKRLRDQAQTIEDHEKTIAKHVARIAELERAERERAQADRGLSLKL